VDRADAGIPTTLISRSQKVVVLKITELKHMRSLYGFLAFLLAIAVMSMTLIVTSAGKCGLWFGFFSSLIGISLVFWPLMFIAAIAASALVYRFGVRLLMVECALALACIVSMYVYSSLPYGRTASLAGQCQVNAP
jgi:hypothetical protein